ncbi:MAG: PrgI family mobile element protein [Candidatus Dormibacterales bacterium]
MAARVPLDVDLEDKLLYGLTPMRLAYVVAAVASAFAVWSSHWAPTAVRACVAGLVMALGASAGWGRWRGRPADRWLADMARFVGANYRVELDRRWSGWLVRRRSST